MVHLFAVLIDRATGVFHDCFAEVKFKTLAMNELF